MGKELINEVNIVNYSSIMRKETVNIFYEKFWKRLIANLIKHFGNEEARKIQGAVQSNVVKIESVESYLFATSNLNDPSFELYNQCNSFEDFYVKSMVNLKRRVENGETDIIIREFFLVLIDMLSKENCIVPNNNLCNFLKFFITFLTNVSHISPFTIQILDPYYALQIQDTLGLDLSKANEFLETFLLCYNELAQGKHTLPVSTFLPKVQLVFPAYKETKFNQTQYLASLFSETFRDMRKLTTDIPSLSEDTAQLRTLLESLIHKHKIENLEVEEIIEELKEFKDTTARTCIYNMYHSLIERQRFSKLFGKIMRDRRIERIMPEYETYIKTFQPYYSNVFINCTNIKEQDLIFLIDVAKNLNLLKSYMFPYIRSQKVASPNFKITFTGVDFMHTRFVDVIKEKLKQIESDTNKNFFVEILGDTTDVKHQYDIINTHNIRIISDIHYDYNIEHRYKFNFGEDFVINCGDTAGNAPNSIKWIKSNMKRGVVVTGNHLGYTPLERGVDRETSMESTRTSQMEMLQKEFSGKNKVQFLENSVTEHQGIIILGTCLYSDFGLYGNSNIEGSMMAAKSYLNDFKYVKILNTGTPVRKKGMWKLQLTNDKNPIRTITPQDYAYFFQKACNFLKEKVREFRYSPIIVVTHFAPSIYSISSEFIGSPVNPAFASDLHEFILENPNIRIWTHGHCHKPFDYILGETRVICEPFGYNNENKAKLPLDYGKRISIKDIKSSLPWTEICKEDIARGKMKAYTC